MEVTTAEINAWLRRFTPQPMDKTDGGIGIPSAPNFSAVSDTQICSASPSHCRHLARAMRVASLPSTLRNGPAIRLVLEQGIWTAHRFHAALYMPLYERLLAAYRLTDEYKALAQAWQKVSRLKSGKT